MNSEERLFDKLYRLSYYSGSINYCAMGDLLNNLNLGCNFGVRCSECCAEHLREEYINVGRFE